MVSPFIEGRAYIFLVEYFMVKNENNSNNSLK